MTTGYKWIQLGSVLGGNTGTKTSASVDLKTATGIYDKLIKEKMGKGYTLGSGAP